MNYDDGCSQWLSRGISSVLEELKMWDGDGSTWNSYEESDKRSLFKAENYVALMKADIGMRANDKEGHGTLQIS